MAEIIGIRFKREGKQYYFDPQGLQLEPGVGVIVETSWGLEYGECVLGNSEVSEEKLVAPLRPVIRVATPADDEVVRKNREKEKDAFDICQKKIVEHGLDMKLVEVEYSFEGNKILFFFTSEGRVDFRALVKDLAAIFHSRIELRQIGVRDEAKMLGGLGICGRPFCCSSFLREFQPVSIKMAKTQSLSLNPTKISGTCGRLMCCLKYEQEAYEDLLKTSPKTDSFVETPDGVGDIISVNTLREKVRVRLDNAPDTLKIYHNSEIRVIRPGKGKRPEGYIPPSPQELEKLRQVKDEAQEEKRKPSSVYTAPTMRKKRMEPLAEPPVMELTPKEERVKKEPQGKKEEKKPGGKGHSRPHHPHSGHRKDRKPEKERSAQHEASKAPKKEQEPQTANGGQEKQNKHGRHHHNKHASKAAMDKALPKEKSADGKEEGEKKPHRPYWRKKPHHRKNNKPKEGQAE